MEGIKLKLVLITPSNKLYMPYVNNYILLLEEKNIAYDIIIWDRFHINESGDFVYSDSKTGHKRNFYDYLKYSRYIKKTLKKNKYDKVIVFGLQVSFFLQRVLSEYYKGKYIFDIRDYNKIIKFINVEKIIENSFATVISSGGYKNWLPSSKKLTLNHNINVYNTTELKQVINQNQLEQNIKIGSIGAIRDYRVNIDFIENLKHIKQITLNYHGEGTINDDLQRYIKQNKIENVHITGRYRKEEEELLYAANNFINVLRYNDGINNYTALPNRLYNAVIYGKPLIAYKGTYLADVIKMYNLGIVISSFDQLEDYLSEKIKKFNYEKYNTGRKEFIEAVLQENLIFRDKLIQFLNSNPK